MNRLVGYRPERRIAGINWTAVGKHETRAAQTQPTAEARPLQIQVIAQYVQQRGVVLGANLAALPVHC
jgi:hypothetical protein